MNMLFAVAGNESLIACAEKLINHYHSEKAFLTVLRKEIIPTINAPFTYIYDYQKVMHGDYSNVLGFESAYPIDSELLERLQPYLFTTLKMMERIPYAQSFEARMELYFAHVQYWNHILDHYQINVYVGFNIPHEGYDYIIYSLCQIKNIPCVFYLNTFLPTVGYFCDGTNKWEQYFKKQYIQAKNIFKERSSEQIPLTPFYQQVYDSYSGGSQIAPWYMTYHGRSFTEKLQWVPQKLKREGLKRCVQAFGWYWKNRAINIGHRLSRQKLLQLWKKYQTNSIDYNKKYIYFALHMQPEASTTPMGEFFTYQLLAIQMLSKALPKNWLIYVKENPKQTMRGRTKEFIKDLSNTPNVIMVSPKENTHQLLEKCQAVATITGTVGWEALFMGKPALFWGEYLLKMAPNAYSIATNQDCEKALLEIEQGNKKWTEKDIKVFIYAMQNFCSHASNDTTEMISQKISEEKNTAVLAEGYINYINNYINAADIICEQDKKL